MRAAVFLLLGLAPGAAAQSAASPWEVSTYHHGVSGGYGDWSGLIVRASAKPGRTTLIGDVAVERRFRDDGVYASLQLLRDVSPSTFLTLGAGTGTGRLIHPDLRADASINRKFLARRQLVLSLGGGYVNAADPYEDRYTSVGAAWYFVRPLVVQVLGSVSRSDPGAVASHSAATTVTWSARNGAQVSSRLGIAREAYQLVADRALHAFGSGAGAVTLRTPIASAWGALLAADAYRNRYYTRAGATLGVYRRR